MIRKKAVATLSVCHKKSHPKVASTVYGKTKNELR